MFGYKIDRVLDFNRKFIGLQLSSRDSSSHKKPQLGVNGINLMLTRDEREDCGGRPAGAPVTGWRGVLYSPPSAGTVRTSSKKELGHTRALQYNPE